MFSTFHSFLCYLQINLKNDLYDKKIFEIILKNRAEFSNISTTIEVTKSLYSVFLRTDGLIQKHWPKNVRLIGSAFLEGIGYEQT